jgi:histidine triad (HIT) family protein
MEACIFCEILSGKAPASLVYQDDICLAFMDIQPINPGHMLLIPRQHAASLADLPLEIGSHLFQVGQRLVQGLRLSGLPCEGVNLMLADGEAAGQDVFHVHLHIVPRLWQDGFGFKFPDNFWRKPPRAHLDLAAQKIRRALGSD